MNLKKLTRWPWKEKRFPQLLAFWMRYLQKTHSVLLYGVGFSTS